MQTRPRLGDLISRARDGDEEAMMAVIRWFIPAIKHHHGWLSRMGYYEAGSDLVAWVISAVHRYQPRATWETDKTDLTVSWRAV